MSHVDVAIVGAGFAGIGMGIRLKRRGVNSFLVLERGASVGGTWRDNTYPGVACDIPSHLYSFSFRPNPDWSAFFSPGDEIRRYLENSAADEGLTPHLRFDAEVSQMVWDASESVWRLATPQGEVTARALVLACGRLTAPRIPDVPGLDTFAGPQFHSARWDHSVDLRGKRVAVVGSGASAVQLIPHLAEQASELVVLQRSAPYVIPRDERAYSTAERRLFARDPAEIAVLRSQLFWKAEEAFAQRAGDPAQTDAAKTRALRHLDEQVPDAALREKLTPTYEIGCKRVLISSDYYPALMRANVTVEASALKAVEGNTLIAANGSRHEADVVIYATGFHAAQQPYAGIVMGVDGERLADHWSHGMVAHASTVVHGFPNLFVINGPNAGLGHNSAIYMIESQIDYVLGAFQRLFADDDTVLNVSREAEVAYTQLIDSLSSSTVWMTGGCESWYRDSRTGRLTLLWPGFAHEFRRLNGEFSAMAFEPAADLTQ
jgi:cation diffusion facilitator CzcD-associated flavoprotein CzcO